MFFIQADEFPISAYLKKLSTVSVGKFTESVREFHERKLHISVLVFLFGNKSVAMTIMWSSSTAMWRNLRKTLRGQ
jgi:hypothetical protein